jgi:hypothetical protein
MNQPASTPLDVDAIDLHIWHCYSRLFNHLPSGPKGRAGIVTLCDVLPDWLLHFRAVEDYLYGTADPFAGDVPAMFCGRPGTSYHKAIAQLTFEVFSRLQELCGQGYVERMSDEDANELVAAVRKLPATALRQALTSLDEPDMNECQPTQVDIAGLEGWLGVEYERAIRRLSQQAEKRHSTPPPPAAAADGGKAATTDDLSAYRPAIELWSGRFRTYKQWSVWLKKQGTAIRQDPTAPKNRPRFHAGDFAEVYTAAEKLAFESGGAVLEAFQQGAADRQAELRADKEKKQRQGK